MKKTLGTLAIIAEVLAYEHCKRVNPKADHPIMGYHTFHPDQREHLRGVQMDVARAVLAALEGAGHVEWGTGEGVKLMTWRDRGQAERQSASATRSTDGGKTWQHTNPHVVSRIVGPWEAQVTL